MTSKKSIPISNAYAKEVCAVALGSPISPATWSKWKKDLIIKTRSRNLTFENFKLLQAYAILRKENPNAKIIRKDVTDFINGNSASGDFITIASQAVKRHEMERISHTRIGRDLPMIIKNVLGREVNFSTLYFWGKQNPQLKFSKSRRYNFDEIQKWLEIASKYA